VIRECFTCAHPACNVVVRECTNWHCFGSHRASKPSIFANAVAKCESAYQASQRSKGGEVQLVDGPPASVSSDESQLAPELCPQTPQQVSLATEPCTVTEGHVRLPDVPVDVLEGMGEINFQFGSKPSSKLLRPGIVPRGHGIRLKTDQQQAQASKPVVR
jgi:hypothetical protein